MLLAVSMSIDKVCTLACFLLGWVWGDNQVAAAPQGLADGLGEEVVARTKI